MATNTNVIKFQPKARRQGGFTAVPHDLLEAVASGKFKGQQARVLLAVARLTLGWQQERAVLTLGRIAEVTNMKATHIAKALRELEAMGAIEVAYTKAGRIIGIIDDYANWADQNGHSKTVTSDQSGHSKVTNLVTDPLDKESIKHTKNPPVVPQTPEEALTGPADADASAACVSADAEANQPAKPKTSAARFAEFWAAYPRKVGKAPSLAKWKAKRLDALADRILADIAERSRRDRKWLEGYIPNPLTYLTQERWEDEIEAPRAQAKPQQPAEPVRRRRELGV